MAFVQVKVDGAEGWLNTDHVMLLQQSGSHCLAVMSSGKEVEIGEPLDAVMGKVRAAGGPTPVELVPGGGKLAVAVEQSETFPLNVRVTGQPQPG